MLSNFEIEDFLFPLSSTFCGVFSSDNIPTDFLCQQQKFSIICNLSREKEPGSHFVTILSPNRQQIYYIDSYGVPPPAFGGIPLFLKQVHREKIVYSTSCIQHYLSTFCGFFATFFVLNFEYKLPFPTDSFHTVNSDQCHEKLLLTNDDICKKLIKDTLIIIRLRRM